MMQIIKNHYLIFGFLIIVLFIFSLNLNYFSEVQNNAVEIEVIWDNANHNAFTDLIYFQNKWYCVFREATTHFSGDGKIRVISSDNGKKWESIASIDSEKGDLRDPKLSITNDNKLMLNAGIKLEDFENGYSIKSVTWLLNNKERWEGPYASMGLGTWRWSTSWLDGYGYSVGYTNKDKMGTIYTTSNGQDWRVFKENIFPSTINNASEASITFDKDSTAYMLLRGKNTSLLGESIYPYKDWIWNDLNLILGGPKLLILSSGRLISVNRLFIDNEPKTVVSWVNIQDNTLETIIELPSGGDTGYAGVIERDEMLWVSYHSSHTGKSIIYLAKIKL